MASDPFDDVFTLEDRFYRQGYQQGLDDGQVAGRIEGRQFGMSTGFDKFLASSRLASRAVIWANCLPPDSLPATTSSSSSTASCTLPPLAAAAANARLGKNVKMLYALVEPDTLSTDNADEAVQDFDDRFKRAQGKAKVIEKTLG